MTLHKPSDITKANFLRITGKIGIALDENPVTGVYFQKLNTSPSKVKCMFLSLQLMLFITGGRVI